MNTQTTPTSISQIRDIFLNSVGNCDPNNQHALCTETLNRLDMLDEIHGKRILDIFLTYENIIELDHSVEEKYDVIVFYYDFMYKILMLYFYSP